MKTKRIVGELHPTNKGSVTNNTAYQIYNAVESHALERVIYNAEGWSEGIITIDTTSLIPSDMEMDPAKEGGKMYFMALLSQFIRAEGVDELGLEGTIVFSVKDINGAVDSTEFFVRRGAVETQGDIYRYNLSA